MPPVAKKKPVATKPSAKAGTADRATRRKLPQTKAGSTPANHSAASKTASAPVPNIKPPKPRKPKLVRDSFTIPKAEYLAIAALKERAVHLARPAKKSEILRVGLINLAALSDAAYLAALNELPIIKTGRPKKN